jgi:hypothetical protein
MSDIKTMIFPRIFINKRVKIRQEMQKGIIEHNNNSSGFKN